MKEKDTNDVSGKNVQPLVCGYDSVGTAANKDGQKTGCTIATAFCISLFPIHQVRLKKWSDVMHWNFLGGTQIGTTR